MSDLIEKPRRPVFSRRGSFNIRINTLSTLFNNFPLFADINDCEPDPCQNGGVCQDKVNDYDCTCQPGYEGKNCETSKMCYNFYDT